jgi:hypothetical protein
LRGAQREPRGAALPPRPLFVRIKRIAVPSQPLSLSLSLSPPQVAGRTCSSCSERTPASGCHMRSPSPCADPNPPIAAWMLPACFRNRPVSTTLPLTCSRAPQHHQRTDICPQRKERSSTSHARNPFNLFFLFLFGSCLMVRRWRLIGYFPILYNPSTINQSATMNTAQ